MMSPITAASEAAASNHGLRRGIARFAVIGAGNGGLATAADLILRGFPVTALYDRYDAQLRAVREHGAIEAIGAIRGKAPVRLATTDMQAATRAADVLLITVPAFAHEWVARAMAPHIRPDQAIVLCPGYFGGSRVFGRAFAEAGTVAAMIVETVILPYACRIVAPGLVSVRAVKRWLEFAALPAHANDRAAELLQPAFPQLQAVRNVLEVGVNNPNPIMHVPLTLLNMARAESDEAFAGIDFHDWITPSVDRLMKQVDLERLQLARRLGFRGVSVDEWYERSYRGVERHYADPTGDVPEGSKNIPPRYITEDVPMGLVPLVSLADQVGQALPVTRMLIDLAGIVHGTDYWAQGRTMDGLGLGGLAMEGLLEAVR